MKIRSKISEAADGWLYFASMDEKGEAEDGSRLPIWGSHLWRCRPDGGAWEHLAAVPEGLIAVAVGGRFVYALGLFEHIVYQFDTETGGLRRHRVGSVGGHVSRNILADSRGHVYVPRLRQLISPEVAEQRHIPPEARLEATLVELDSSLRELRETPLADYVNTDRWADHGIVGFTHLRDGSIAFTTSRGGLHRIFPAADGPAAVVALGWFHPDGDSYAPTLFTYDGRESLIGLAKRSSGWDWVYYPLSHGRSVATPFPPAVVPSDALLYGSEARDDAGAFFVVGQEDGAPVALRLIPRLNAGP